MAVFLVTHGGWQAGWAWKKMRPLMAARGHELFTPSLTGLGERAHLAHRDLNLETHVAECVEQKFVLKNGPLTLPRAYIYCRRHLPGDPFRRFLESARKDGWTTYEMDASHSPHITAPEALMEILETIAKD